MKLCFKKKKHKPTCYGSYLEFRFRELLFWGLEILFGVQRQREGFKDPPKPLPRFVFCWVRFDSIIVSSNGFFVWSSASASPHPTCSFPLCFHSSQLNSHFPQTFRKRWATTQFLALFPFHLANSLFFLPFYLMKWIIYLWMFIVLFIFHSPFFYSCDVFC